MQNCFKNLAAKSAKCNVGLTDYIFGQKNSFILMISTANGQ